MSRERCLKKYVDLCRAYNASGEAEHRVRAESYLEGVCDAIADGEMERLYDFCCASDEAAAYDGIDAACWGIKL